MLVHGVANLMSASTGALADVPDGSVSASGERIILVGFGAKVTDQYRA